MWARSYGQAATNRGTQSGERLVSNTRREDRGLQREVHMLPDTLNGLPVHALSVHATVVLVPLAAALGVLFAVPRLREWTTFPLPLVAAGAAIATWVSVQSGEALKAAGGQGAAGLGGPVAELVAEHQDLGNQLLLMVVAYAVAVTIAVVVVRRAGRGVTIVLSVLVVLGAVAVGVQTFRVGELGSRAVWNPTDTVDYGSTDRDN